MDQVAEAVYVIHHRDGEGGNTTVIVGQRDVLVVDATLYPYAAREDIAEIARLTPKPVRFLVNTHWHNDHVMGNQAYAAAFPGLAIVAQVETKRDMDLNLPNAGHRADERLAGAVTLTNRALASGVDGQGAPLTPQGRSALEHSLPRWRQAAADNASWAHQSATMTFERELTIDLGGREVRVQHLGRGNTNGDAIVYLPAERVVMAGDLLVRPLPYFYDGYPSEWVRTLDALSQFDATTIVPGHGDVMHDWTYLHAVRDLMQSAIDQVNARLRVIGPAEVHSVDEVAPHVDMASFRNRFTAGDAAMAGAFDETAAELVRLVFREASLR